MKFLSAVFLAVLLTFPVPAADLSLATLNCYWFLGSEESQAADKPRTTEEYSLKAGHLIGLLPAEAPLLIGLQEIGNDQDVAALALSASRRYKRNYVPLFFQGNDTATKQDVGALFATGQGWSVYGKASRVSELEREVSKHLVVRLTNALTHLDICVVHLRVPRDAAGKKKQLEQNRALLRWAMRHLAKDPKANLIIMGDFNEGGKVGSPNQSLAVLFQSEPLMVDTFSRLSGRITTHAGGGAYDRILVSSAIMQGASHLQFKNVQIIPHRHGKGPDKRLYTDHFPVVLTLSSQD